jgi:hypothetical protein
LIIASPVKGISLLPDNPAGYQDSGNKEKKTGQALGPWGTPGSTGIQGNRLKTSGLYL